MPCLCKSQTDRPCHIFDRRTLTAVSEELEHSLQQAIETYLGQRLHAIEEQISQLQTEFGEALTRLRESTANESLSETALSASIFAHFQAARAQQLTGAAALA